MSVDRIRGLKPGAKPLPPDRVENACITIILIAGPLALLAIFVAMILLSL